MVLEARSLLTKVTRFEKVLEEVVEDSFSFQVSSVKVAVNCSAAELYWG